MLSNTIRSHWMLPRVFFATDLHYMETCRPKIPTTRDTLVSQYVVHRHPEALGDIFAATI
jgi:hypothetical protein